MTATYNFLPWVRQGIASAIPAVEKLDKPASSHVSLPIKLRVNDRKDASIHLQLRLYGPGDVTGIDPLQVVRTEPPHLTTDFEPNLFPAIEFDHPSFPWLFNPGGANPQGQLLPWIALIVVRKQAGVHLSYDQSRPRPVLTLQAPASISQELPDLAESWAWAHTQVVSADPATAIDPLLASNAESTVSRLLCLRHLEPNTAYYACLVPTFEAGRRAGLGLPTSETEEAPQPAWQVGEATPDRLELPVYYHWEFTTGLSGDFESLLRLLQHRRLPQGVGVRSMTVNALTLEGVELPALQESLGLEGALRPPGAEPIDLPADFQERLRTLLNLTNQPTQIASPLLGPPLYGQWQTTQTSLPADRQPPHWLRQLNLDPRNRVAAGFGTLVVQDQQEQLMTAAWEQLEQQEPQRQTERQQHLAQTVGQQVFNARLKPLSPELLLQLTGPIAATDRGSPAVRAVHPGYNLPAVVGSAPFRRVLRPTGPIARRTPALNHNRERKKLVRRLVEEKKPVASLPKPPFALPTVEKLQQTLQQRLNLKPDQVGFLRAAIDHQAYYQSILSQPAPPSPPPVKVAEIQAERLDQLNPEKTAPSLRAATKAVDRSALSFPQPMYEALRDISQDLLLPGLEQVPPNTITLLETNPRFVEAYMVGLNHEMGRELLWRGYPIDQRSTYFQQFWDVRGLADSTNRDALKDIPPIHTWQANKHLGQHFKDGAAQKQLVLLIRGELLRRYPTAILYAVQAVRNSDGQLQLSDNEKHPLFWGRLEPDITFLGFDLTAAQARGSNTSTNPGYFFVIQQQPTEPRFGFDATLQNPQPATWEELSWQQVATRPGGHLAIRTPTPAIAAINDPRGQWGLNAAHMAGITLKRPVRIAIHARDLLPELNSAGT